MRFRMLILLALLTNLSQAYAQELSAFVTRTNQLVTALDENASRIVAAKHHQYYFTDIFLNFLAIRPNDMNQDGYANNVEQASKATREADDATERLTTQKQNRLVLKDDLEFYLSETDGPFNAADIKKEVSRVVHLQDELIATTHSFLDDKAYVFNPTRQRSGIAPAPQFVRNRMNESEQAISRIKLEIQASMAKIGELESMKAPPTLKERAYQCWQSVTSALIPAK